MAGMRLHARLISMLVVLAPAVAGADAVPGDTEFVFSGWSGPAIRVRMHVPQDLLDSTPIVIVMHGASRDLDRYFEDWKAQSRKHGFVSVVPEFSADDFPKSARYNLGHVFDPETREKRPEALWTFSAIEPLFDHVVGLLGGSQAGYTLFGHSAGSQFVHRFLYYKPRARVDRAILANAGWYTVPDFGVRYPYGLAESGVGKAALSRFLQRDIAILLGENDDDPNGDKLRKTPEAELQGPHRLARGKTMYRVARARAARLGIELDWTLQILPGAGHSNAAMAPAAALLVKY